VVAHPAAAARIAEAARPKRRHRLILASFAIVVLAPSLAALAYLYLVAADQYASRMAFSVRGADNAAPIELLGALTSGLGGPGSGADAEIVYEFVRSQQMVEAAMAALPLVEIYNRPQRDVVFRLGEDQPIEDVVEYWNRMTDVAFDASSGIVLFEARAFDPESARAIATLVLSESTRVVNDLSTQAREDAVSVAREVLDEAEARLRGVRRDLRAFRDIEQELDPSENARAALGLAAALETELAQTEVELDTQTALVGERGPRIAFLRQKIASLRDRIAAERARIGDGESAAAGARGRGFADLVAEYEDLIVDREFAENAYVSALASFEQAQVEARRQMRYLAPHVRPTLSVSPEYPQRALMAGGAFGALLIAWSVGLLIVYNIRDRR
jgi:capsular polysaccharide transport system permease protein